MKVLLTDIDSSWVEKTTSLLKLNSIESKHCINGKDTQLEVYRGSIDCVVLNVDTDNYSGLMVMKYLRLNYPLVRLVVVIENKTRLKDLGMDQTELKRLGASTVLIKPIAENVLLQTVKGESYDSWKEVTLNDQPMEKEQVTLMRDDEFTRVKIEACQSGNLTIFDHYIRLGPGRFIKVLRKGDAFDKPRIDKMIAEKKVEFLYFKTKDRTAYINYMNELTQKAISSGKKTSQAINAIKVATDMYIDEIYTTGIKPLLLEEGKKICQNIHQVVKSDGALAKYVREMLEADTNGHGHLFLVSFFSTIICKNLPWAGSRTVETIVMGGLLHDIGKLKLPTELRGKKETELTEKQKIIFQQHPLFGVELLNKSPIIGDQVKQIVYQHHELVNGTGYPNALTGSRIYPLAKIISLADHFANLLTSNKITPIEGLRLFIPNKLETIKYDAEAIKSLVLGLTR